MIDGSVLVVSTNDCPHLDCNEEVEHLEDEPLHHDPEDECIHR